MRKFLTYFACVLVFAIGCAVAVAAGGGRSLVCHGHKCNTTSTAPTTTTVPTTTSSSPGPLGPTGSWNLVFSDNFTQDSSLGSAWVNQGWGNCSLSFDSTNGLGFHLGSAADGNGCQIMSNQKFLYGAFEAVVSFPSRPSSAGCKTIYPVCGADHMGWWTAGDTWPNDGEFDIAEGGGGYPLGYYIHSSAGQTGRDVSSSAFDAFHTYTVEWTSTNTVTVYWDGQQVGQQTNVPLTTAGQHLRANLYTCISGCGETGYIPANMYVKYIKAWQR